MTDALYVGHLAAPGRRVLGGVWVRGGTRHVRGSRPMDGHTAERARAARGKAYAM
ncbi:hypothetical protein ACFU8W_49900 [Streptomyces sp. NPDC057565]|uniref:hypothetical protein n=1 Tax=Streptomyces sp. NPDC057565 TaxID=3346169 RepID=UPI003673A3B4